MFAQQLRDGKKASERRGRKERSWK